MTHFNKTTQDVEFKNLPTFKLSREVNNVLEENVSITSEPYIIHAKTGIKDEDLEGVKA